MATQHSTLFDVEEAQLRQTALALDMTYAALSRPVIDIAAEVASTIQPEGCTCQDQNACDWCRAKRIYTPEP
jgi:hypothetical protein